MIFSGDAEGRATGDVSYFVCQITRQTTDDTALCFGLTGLFLGSFATLIEVGLARGTCCIREAVFF